MTKLHYGFLDESGIVEEQAHKGNYFVIVVLIVGNPSELKPIVKRARHKLKQRVKTHRIFHAHKENPHFVKMVLKELAKQDVRVVIGFCDKRESHHAHRDKNLRYAHYVALTVAPILVRWPQLALTVHKRYTLPVLQVQMNRVIQEYAQEYIPQEGVFLSIDHRTEVECKELELADAVAWAVFQKYNRHDPSFYDIIKEKIQKENRLAA